MPDLSTISLVASIIFGCTTVYFATKGSKRTDAKDIEERVKSDTILNVKLDSIGKNVSDIKVDLSSVKDDIKNMDRRLIVVEQSVKSAHHRIDTIEKHREVEEHE